MYFSETELHKIIDDLISCCDHVDHPFDANGQVKVCSIDIRVANTFWVPKKQSHSMDLGGNKIFEISPRRMWRKTILEDGESIVLKPGQMILGRTYEKINMPREYVGKLTTRSSFARLGLWTAGNCDLVNPGYKGYVPLELMNTSPNKMVIRPFLPLCQLFVMPLQGELSDSYDHDKYKSKYMDDDGGPSVWWRDDLVRKISKKVPESTLAERLAELQDEVNKLDDDCLYRLEKMLDSEKFSNPDDLLEKFSRREKSAERWYKIKRGMSLWFFPCFLALFLGEMYTGSIKAMTEAEAEAGTPYLTVVLYISIVVLFVSFLPFLYYALKNKTQFFNRS